MEDRPAAPTPRPTAGPLTGDGSLPRGYHVLVTAAAAMIVIAGLRAFHSSIAPIFLALVIVVVISPLHGGLRKRGAPSWLAMLVLFAATFGILLLIVGALVWSTTELVLLVSSESYTSQLGETQDLVAERLDRLGLSEEELQQALARLDIGVVAGRITSALSGLLGVTSAIGLLMITMLFMVLDTERFRQNLKIVAEHRPDVARGLEQFADQTRTYFVVSTVFGLIVAGLDVLALVILGVPLALVWGVLSLITNYIPNIGFVLGLIPPALLAFFEGGWELSLWVIAVYSVINLVIQAVIQPKIVGDAVGLSATLTFVSLIFWGWVLGPLGALLAVPMTLLAKSLLIDIDPSTRWADPLISLPTGPSGEVLPPDESGLPDVIPDDDDPPPGDGDDGGPVDPGDTR